MIVEALDGSASLTVPPEAIPSGVDPSSITMTALAEEELLFMEEGTVIAAYDLQPDGLEFSEPITLTIRLPLPPEGGSIQLLHNVGEIDDSDDVFEPVEIQDVVVDSDTGLVTATAELSHFSKVIASKGVYDLELEAPDTVEVDQPFTATVTVIRTSRISARTIKDRKVTTGDDWDYISSTQAAPGPWSLTGDFLGIINLDPSGKIGNRPPSTSVSTSTFSVQQQFTCKRPGRFLLSYSMFSRFHPVQLTTIELGEAPKDAGIIRLTDYGSIEFEGTCVAPLPTDTPVPTPTPTSEPLAPFATIFAPTSTTPPTPTPTPTPMPTPTPVPEIGLILNPPATSIRLAGTSTRISVSGLTPGGTFTQTLCDPNGACQSSQLMADADGKFTGTTGPLEVAGTWRVTVTDPATGATKAKSFEVVAPPPSVDEPRVD